MTEDDIRRIIREELAARAPQIVVIPQHPQPMPIHRYPAPMYPGGPWLTTCAAGVASDLATTTI